MSDPNFPLHHKDASPPNGVTDSEKTLDDPAAASRQSTASDPQEAAMPAPPPREAAASSLALRAGYALHEYRVNALLGQGGFGITYLATDVNLGSKVAIKEYLPAHFAYRSVDQTVSARSTEDQALYQHGLESFLVEARTLATFRHPNIVRVARFFSANNTAYMVLEYERGKSLRNWWRTRAQMSERELLTQLLPMLDGLAVVHEAGFLHRDIKPDNIVVRDEDGSWVLVDFGAARRAAGGQLEDSRVVTPGYGPSEQYLQVEQGPWTDIYALGATLYWMISGKKPVDAPARTAANDPLVPAVDVGKGRYSPEFLRAIDCALKPDAKDRPQDILQFRTALYAAHASSLGLQEALRAGEGEAVGVESWLDMLRTPRLLRGRLQRFGRMLVRPGSWPMAVKMMLAMVATALAPMLITAYYNLNGSVSRVSEGELRNLEQLAVSVAGRVSQLIVDSSNQANYLGTDDDFVGFLMAPTERAKAAIKSKLDALVKTNPDVQLVMVFDTAGTAVVSSDPEVMGRNFKFREYFKVAMEGRPYITGIIVGAVAGQAGIFYANPILNPKAKVIGAVVLRIKAASVSAILNEAQQGNDRIPFLINGDGVLIHHPNEKLLYRSLVPLSKEKLAEILADQRFRRDKIESVNMPELAKAMVGTQAAGRISYLSTISGKQEIAGFAPVKGHNWVVGVTETREYFASPLNQLFENMLYSVVVVGAVFLLLAVLFARSIVRPIEQMTGAAHALKSGDYDKANIKVTSGDEIGQLARTFNVMIDVLRQRERERGDLARRSVSRGSAGKKQ